MKSESSAFGTARLDRNGRWPVFLFRFSNPALKVSTARASVDNGDSYEPWVLSFDPALFSVEPFGHLGALGTLAVTLARNATTDVLLGATSYALQAVQVDAAFIPSNLSVIAAADLVPVARMVFGQVKRADQAEIEVELWNDETKLLRIPRRKLSSTALVVPEENKNVILPILIGDFRKAATSNDEFYRCRSENYAPLVLADELYRASQTYGPFSKTNLGKHIICENDVGSGTDPVVNQVFEYFPEIERFGFVGTVNDSGGSPTYLDVATWLGDNIQSEPFAPSGVFVARVRLTADRNLYRLGEVDGPTNELNDSSGATNYIWKNSCDADESNYAELRLGQSPVRTRLALSFLKRGNLSASFPRYLFQYLEVKNAEKVAGGGTRLLVRIATVSNGGFSGATAIDIISSTTLPAVYVVGPWLGGDAIDTNGTTLSQIGWGFENIVVRLEITGVTSQAGQFANIGFYGIELQWVDAQAQFLKARRSIEAIEGEMRPRKYWWEPKIVRTNRRVWQVNDVYAAGRKKIFADVTGPRSFAASPTNPDGLSFTHASFVLAGLLCDVLSYPYSEVDGANLKRVQLFYPSCDMSFFLQNETDALEVLKSVCQQFNVILFRSSSGVWKIVPRNSYLTIASPSFSAPVTAFGDAKVDYLVEDLQIEKIEPVYNKFTVHYQYDWAREKFAAESTVDYSGTFPTGQEMPPVEAPHLRTSTAAAALAAQLRDYYGKAHKLLRFRSSAAAAIIEPGDYVTVEHAALPTQNPLPKYQVTDVEYYKDAVWLTALEVTG